MDNPPPDESTSLAFAATHAWLDRAAWRSYDVCDVRAHPIFLRSRMLARRGRCWELATAPLNHLERQHKGLVRRVLRIPQREYAQAHALGARAAFARWSATGEKYWIDKGLEHLRWLEMHSEPTTNGIAWGQPYDWPSQVIIPAGTPRTTVTSIAVQAFLDGHEATGDPQLLNVADQACRFFTDDLHHSMDSAGDICFAYTTIDTFRVHNANMVGAAALLRTAAKTGKKEDNDLAMSAARFTVKEQGEDGSWFYWSPRDPPTRIDHYHTGFVLEALSDMKVVLNDKFPFRVALDKGTAFYANHLFDSDGAPRQTVEKRDPIDIQSCAQAIITFAALTRQDVTWASRATDIVGWTLDHMYDQNGSFYYRRTAAGVDRTPYVRWGQSWMLRALAEVLALPSDAPQLWGATT